MRWDSNQLGFIISTGEHSFPDAMCLERGIRNGQVGMFVIQYTILCTV